jgi:hypothetical protein
MANVSGAAPDLASLRRAAWFLAGLAFFYCTPFEFCSVSLAQSQDHSSTLAPERGVKAAFLYKFAGYIDWPAGTFQHADTAITISVAGDDQLADALAQYVSSRTVDDRPLVVKRLKSDDSLEGVHILFIARGDGTRLRMMEKLPGPTLIVTEADGALNQGSAINFLITGGRVRFEISLENAERRRLKLGSGLLRVAQNVRSGAP